MEKVSIIVPVYNAEKTLYRCVNALMNQTYSNIEIILVNDGSKDRSYAMCCELAAQDKRIVVIDKQNGGVSSARNEGLKAASGKYILFCDSDDWAESNWCEVLINNYQENMLVMCGYYIEGENNPLSYEIKPDSEWMVYKKTEIFALSLYGIKTPWNKIYSKEIIDLNNIKFDERLSNGEDFLFNICYLNAIQGDIKFLGCCVFHYYWPEKENLSNHIDLNYFKKCCILFCEEKTALSNIFSQKLPAEFYTEFYAQFERIIEDILRERSSYIKKHKKLNCIMKNDIYRQVIRNTVASQNKIYNMVCRSCWPLFMIVWDELYRKFRGEKQ